MTAPLLLALLLGGFVLFMRADATRLSLLRGWPSRDRRYALLAGKAFVLLGLGAVAALAAAGRLDALVRLPPALAPARAAAVALVGEALPLDLLVQAMAAGILGGGIFAALLERRGRRLALGDHRAILPRRPRELGWAMLLSVNAGVSEELFFRLAVPLLATAACGSALAGCALGAALFGIAHVYQGWVGVVATLAVGVLLTLVYLVTASLLAAIAVHVVIDLNALVLRPILSGRVRWRAED